MAGTGISVALIAVMIQIIYGSTLTDVDSQQLAEMEAKENPLKRSTDPYAQLRHCLDTHSNCAYWARIGECSHNPGYMHRSCRASCGSCCVNRHNKCQYWASIGECYANPGYMLNNCARSCGQCHRAVHKRDVTGEVPNSPPGTRDDSRDQLWTDEQVKRATDNGNVGPPAPPETGTS